MTAGKPASTSAQSSVPARSWVLLSALLAPATLIMALDRAVVTVAAPSLQNHFGLSLPQLGLVFSVFFWAYAACQIPAGVIVERIGTRKALFAAIILWSVTTAITPYAGSFAFLLIVRVLLGVGQSADWPASIVGINRLFPAKARATANSILLGALYAGPVVGAPLASLLLQNLGLQQMFVVCGAIGVVFSIIWLMFYREPVHQAGDQRPHRPLMTLRLVMKSRRAWALAATYACTASLSSFYLSLFPTYLARARGMGIGQLGLYSAISSAALCVAALAAGPIMARAFERAHAPAASRLPFAIGSLAIVTVLSVALPFLKSDHMILLAACGSLAAIGFAQVATWSVVQDIGRDDTGSLTGLTNLVGNLAAGAMPLIATVTVSYSGGWTMSYLCLAITASIGCVAWLFVDPARPIGSDTETP